MFRILLNHFVNLKRVLNQMTKLKIRNCAAFCLVRKKVCNPPSSFSPNSPSTWTNIQADIDPNDLKEASPAVAPTDSNINTLDYWQQPIDDEVLTISDDVPYLRQSTQNFRFHHPVDAVVLKAISGISVKNPFKSTSARLSE